MLGWLGAGEEREERREERGERREERGAGLKAGCTGSVAANRRLRKDVSLRFIRVCPSPESSLYHTSGNGQAPFFVFRVSRHGHSGPLTECRTRRSRSRSRRIEKSKASHPPDRDRHANSRRRAAEYLFRPGSFRRAVEARSGGPPPLRSGPYSCGFAPPPRRWSAATPCVAPCTIYAGARTCDYSWYAIERRDWARFVPWPSPAMRGVPGCASSESA